MVKLKLWDNTSGVKGERVWRKGERVE
jgi:hypothetical protein